MAARESKRKEKARLAAGVVEAVVQTQAALSAAAVRLHGTDGAAGGRRSILRQLREQPGLTVPELARRRSVSRQYVQTVVNGLLADGLIETRPNPGHKRSPCLEATEAGIALIEEADRREAPFVEAIGAKFKRSELSETIDLLERLRAALDADVPEERHA